MRRKHIPGDSENWNNRPHQGLTSGREKEISRSLSEILDGDFMKWLKNNKANTRDLNRTGTVKSFMLGGKKYVGIIGDNNEHPHTNIDHKAWAAAIFKGYKIIANKIKDSYYPDKPPYELKIPKIYYHTRKDNKEITIVEWIEGLTDFRSISTGEVEISSEHIDSIQKFIVDRHDTVHMLASKDQSKGEDLSIDDKYYAFNVTIPEGKVLVSDDFSARDYHGNEGAENLENMGYCVGKNGEPIIYLTDGLQALRIQTEK